MESHMKIEVIAYEGMGHRLETVKRILAELSARDVTAQLVHASESSVRALKQALAVQVISTHTLRYTRVDADCIVLVDGDILDRKAVEALEALGKDLYIVAPQEALPGEPASSLRELWKGAELFPTLGAEESYPRTFGCHHFAETCFNCELMVMQWKADRRDRAARTR